MTFSKFYNYILILLIIFIAGNLIFLGYYFFFRIKPDPCIKHYYNSEFTQVSFDYDSCIFSVSEEVISSSDIYFDKKVIVTTIVNPSNILNIEVKNIPAMSTLTSVACYETGTKLLKDNLYQVDFLGGKYTYFINQYPTDQATKASFESILKRSLKPNEICTSNLPVMNYKNAKGIYYVYIDLNSFENQYIEKFDEVVKSLKY